MQIVSDDVLERLCRDVIEENPRIVDQYKKGKTKVFKALLGAVAVKSHRQADMGKCTKLLKELLQKPE